MIFGLELRSSDHLVADLQTPHPRSAISDGHALRFRSRGLRIVAHIANDRPTLVYSVAPAHGCLLVD